MRGKHHAPFAVRWQNKDGSWHYRQFSELGGVKELVKDMKRGHFRVTIQTHYASKPIDITDRFV